MTEIYINPGSTPPEPEENEAMVNLSNRTVAEVAVLMRQRTVDIVEADTARRMLAVRQAMRDRQLGSRAIRSE